MTSLKKSNNKEIKEIPIRFFHSLGRDYVAFRGPYRVKVEGKEFAGCQKKRYVLEPPAGL